MIENKQKICDLLLPALQGTRNLYDLVELKYEKDGYNEIVTAIFRNGSKKYATVNMDSGTAMIRDIVGQIV